MSLSPAGEDGAPQPAPEEEPLPPLAPLPEGLDFDALQPRTRHEFELHVSAPEGDLRVPVLVFTGSVPRPRLVLIAGVHGDEFEGPRALFRLAELLHRGRHRGTAVLVPVANPPALQAGSRLSPLDGLNLNRVFPGSPSGSISGRLAHAIAGRVLAGADLVYSLHGSSAWGALQPWVEFQYVESTIGLASYRAALAAGFEDLYPVPYGFEPGLLLSACHDLGVPAIEGERGGAGVSLSRNWRAYVRSTLGVMRFLGLLGSRPAPSARAAVHEHVPVPAPFGGFWEPRVRPGEEVAEGGPLGVLRDLTGRPTFRPTAPCSGPVLVVRLRPSAVEGDRLVTVGRAIKLSEYFEKAHAAAT